jgi:hypothetical protein
VRVANRSDRPLLLLGGEVILGGQQDRILGKDTIVPAREQASLEVFCVEHGRWSGHREFTAAQGMAERKVRYSAKFKSDQGQVWQEVAKKAHSLGGDTATGTYRTVAAGAAGERAVKPYRDHVLGELAKLPEAARLVGVIAAINGRVTSVDLFDRPELFAAYRDKLLDSIFVSAADVPETAAAAKPVAADDVKAMIDRAEKAAPTEVARSKGSRTVQKSAGNVAGSVLEETAPAHGKDKPQAVYRSYQSLE